MPKVFYHVGRVANLLFKSRKDQNLSQRAVGVLLGYPQKGSEGQSLVSAWEHGTRPIRPTNQQCRALAQILKISVSNLNMALAVDEKARSERSAKKAASPKAAPVAAKSIEAPKVPVKAIQIDSFPTKAIMNLRAALPSAGLSSTPDPVASMGLVNIIKSLCLKELSLKDADPKAILRVVRDARNAAAILGIHTTELDPAPRTV